MQAVAADPVVADPANGPVVVRRSQISCRANRFAARLGLASFCKDVRHM